MRHSSLLKTSSLIASPSVSRQSSGTPLPKRWIVRRSIDLGFVASSESPASSRQGWSLLVGPEPLRADHLLTAFDSGKPSLDQWLKQHALEAQVARTARVFVAHDDLTVTGYYALAASAVTRGEVPRRQRGRLPRHPIPCALLARLAVDSAHAGVGLGKALLKDALTRAVAAAESIGIRAVLVHAKDEDARRFYERFDFVPSPTDPLHLFLPIQDIIATMV